jgi:hypothetical protein
VPSATASLVTSACARLIAARPHALAPGDHPRPVWGDAGRPAAWGHPPIRLRCGVPQPDPALEPIEIDGFKLVTQKSGKLVTWTTFDRAVAVAIEVPTAYEEQVYDVQPLVATLKTLPASGS